MTAAEPEPGARAEPEPEPRSGLGSGPGPESRSGTGAGAGGGQGTESGSVSGPMSTSVSSTGPTPISVPAPGSQWGTVTGHIARPHIVSGGLSVLAGLLAILLVAPGSGQVAALGIALGGAAVLAVGVEVNHRGHRLVGIVLGTAGVVGVLAALGWGIAETQAVEQRVEILPGLVGIAVLVGGVTAFVRDYERWFVSTGAGLILMTVVVSGLVEDAPVTLMLAATAATYVAWDCGEQAINLGEQVGRQARTWRPELVHAGAGVVIGGMGVVLAIAFSTVGVSGLPLLGLTTLLAAAVVLAAALST